MLRVAELVRIAEALGEVEEQGLGVVPGEVQLVRGASSHPQHVARVVVQGVLPRGVLLQHMAFAAQVTGPFIKHVVEHVFHEDLGVRGELVLAEVDGGEQAGAGAAQGAGEVVELGDVRHGLRILAGSKIDGRHMRGTRVRKALCTIDPTIAEKEKAAPLARYGLSSYGGSDARQSRSGRSLTGT